MALDSDISQPNLEKGETVSIAGKVMRVPDDKSKIDTATWGLSGQDVSHLMNDRVFIRANAVRSDKEAKQ